MTFKELVEHARNRDCGLLAQQIKLRKQEGYEVSGEPSFRDDAGNVVSAPDGLKLPLRQDLGFWKDGLPAKTEYAESKTTAFREPVFATWENQMRVEIRSIAWADLTLKLTPANDHCDWGGVRKWFFKWFDAEDERACDENGLYGVVHFISDPDSSEGATKFNVDLGSARAEALGDLLDELAKMGFEKCVVGEQAEAHNFVVKADS